MSQSEAVENNRNNRTIDTSLERASFGKNDYSALNKYFIHLLRLRGTSIVYDWGFQGRLSDVTNFCPLTVGTLIRSHNN